MSDADAQTPLADEERFEPLAGLTIVELADSVAGSFCGRILGWLGAEVIRLWPADPCLARTSDLAGSPLGSAVDDYCNAGKGTVVVSSTEEVRAQVRRGSVFLTDRTRDELTELGLDPGRWRHEHPGRVLVSVTGYGLTGPNAERGWSEATIYHDGGEGFLLPGEPVYSEFPDRSPLRGGRFLSEYDAAVGAALGALAALVARERRGRGDVVEVSAQEVQLGLNRTVLSRCFFEERDIDRADRGYDYGGILPCADGFISLRPTEDGQWRSFAVGIGRPELAEDERYATRAARDRNGAALTEELLSWSRSRTRAEIREVLLETSCPGGPFLEAHELLDDPVLKERGLFTPWLGGGRAPGRLFRLHSASPAPAPITCNGASTVDDGAAPLAGLRVVDLTWVAAGPYATELLGFLGADVIKVESRSRPDLFRRLVLAQSGDLDTSIRFVDLNQRKRSICLDLKAPAGREVFTRLAARADLVIDNFRPGVRDRLGIGDEALRAINPRLATVALSGFGATGAMRNRPGYASVFNAESGVGAMTGYQDGPPTEIRDSNDLRTGMATAVGALAALLEMVRHRRAISLDVAAREVLIALQGDAVLEASRGGRPSRSGNAMGKLVPYGCFRTRDGHWVMISVRNREEWRALRLLCRTEALSDPRLDDPAVRFQRRPAVEGAVAAWVAERDAHPCIAQLIDAGVPAAVSASASWLRRDPHLNARGMFTSTEHPRLGEVTLVGPPVRFWSEATGRPAVRPPLLGEHGSEILAVDLGLSAAVSEEIVASGAVEG